MNQPYFDDRETRPADERLAEQLMALRNVVALAKARSVYWGRHLNEFEAESLRSLSDFAELPLTRKSEVAALQAQQPPLGGMEAVPLKEFSQFFQSPGPIFEGVHGSGDGARFARALWAAGLRPGELVHNTFAYHLTPAGSMVERGAQAMGCPVFPAGVGNTDAQLEAIARLRPTFYVGTPSFLKALLDRADDLELKVDSLQRALVSGEPLTKAVRRELAERGVEVKQAFATAELGLIAYETEVGEGLVSDEDILLEVVRPGSGEPLPAGEVGEMVVTLLKPSGVPLIRFATGDLTAVLAGDSPCGRTAARIQGWMGRANQTTKVKGMFVTPEQVDSVYQRYPEIKRARLVVTREQERDQMTLQVELHGSPAADFTERLSASLQAITRLRGEVVVVAPGTLPNDGKVIADERVFDY